MKVAKRKTSNPYKRGSLQLWQFLVYLLDFKKSTEIIQWIDRSSYEFKLIKPEKVAKEWGLHKHRANMNYDKLSRSLRYYYETNIIKKVDQCFAYQFLCNVNIYKEKSKLIDQLLNNSLFYQNKTDRKSVV